ncbi:4-hydroxyphenylacetate 3-hydroxylase family protein [Ancylobacter pratisalsi]|uniref:4-hydroxyphenylacetate 3-monooxygenase n=1 Tax=Ancylobacter pratisalsi TaxID=1745854 RepID=A0A6P1YRR4_9HYPH|nr:4-hydroxyphenylacetate 3-hydroxylase N-terminal domain-containing protein [Ancylobacter pratisalsi]QIB35570.1 4-hydroxyphenylacetate 3-monooxygenase [Ancylobacter pratisalsi]
MRVRDGAEYRSGLNDGRRVLIDGEPVADVTTHPAFRNAVASFARFYDLQADPANRERLTFEVGGARVHKAWSIPRSHAELVDRRRAIAESAALHCGFLGRSPDHLATTLTGMMIGLPVMAGFDAARAEAFAAYFEQVRARDLFVTYVIQNPQADKTRAASEQARDVVAHVVSQDREGIVVSGAKMLGTSAVMADEIFVGTIQPVRPGEERYALSFAVPVNHPGVRLLSRRSYEQGATSGYDYPLSSHFDENDAVLFFDEVRVPWERVFVCGNVAAAAAQWHGTPAHVMQNYQSQIRLMVKMRFLTGLARRIVEINGTIEVPQVRGMLGKLAAQASLVEGLVAGMEAEGRMIGDYYVPSAHLLYAAQTLTQELYPLFVMAIRDLAGGGVIMLPSSVADMTSLHTRDYVEATQVSSIVDAEERVRTMKLAWDALGSEYASRHTQYEMFYGGASYVNHAHMLRTFDWEAARALVAGVLPPPLAMPR